jgi:acetamidase/formamidase
VGRRHEPVFTIKSGDTVVYETRDVSDNQITPESTAEAVTPLDWDRLYPTRRGDARGTAS